MLIALASFVVSLQFGANVIHLTDASFDREVQNRSNTTVWFVMFHRPQCPACIAAYPDLNLASTEAAGMVRFGEIDASVYPLLVRRYPIHSVPKFLIFHAGGYSPFFLQRNAANILNEATRYIPQLATKVDADSLPGKAAVLLTGNGPVPHIWAAISCAFADRSVRIGISANDTLIKKFGVSSLPSIVFVGGDIAQIYKGPINFWSIRYAVKKFIGEDDGPVPPLGDFDTDCSESFCVIAPTSDEFEDMAAEFGGRPFKFFASKDARDAAWIIKDRTMAIKCNNLTQLRESLRAAADGSADWELFGNLNDKDDL